jgi:hypothetical protein
MSELMGELPVFAFGFLLFASAVLDFVNGTFGDLTLIKLGLAVIAWQATFISLKVNK